MKKNPIWIMVKDICRVIFHLIVLMIFLQFAWALLNKDYSNKAIMSGEMAILCQLVLIDNKLDKKGE